MQKDRLNKLIARQQGAITRSQARAVGLSDRSIAARVRAGDWVHVFPCVFRVSTSHPTWLQRLTAAYLWATQTGLENVAISHRSAGRLLSLEGITDDVVELTLPKPRRPPKGIVIHTSRIAARDLVTIGNLKATSPSRTLVDLGSVVDSRRLEVALDGALRRGLTTIDKVRARLAEVDKRGAAIKRLLDELGESGPTYSILERMTLRIIKAHGLPLPVTQYEVWNDDGFVALIDFAYPDLRIAIEVDGYRFHSEKVVWQKDRSELNELTTMGWKLLRFTWDDVRSKPETVARTIAAVLEQTSQSEFTRQR